jgi:4-amino-4-deoxy-L-arabinose transferase-like glycosyltransferase
LTLALVFVFARRFLGRIEAVFVACLLAFSPAFVEWGLEVHPDSSQMFLIMLSLYWCARAVAPAQPTDFVAGKAVTAPRFDMVLAAAAAAGAAFGTKYQGVFLLPLLAAAVLMMPVGDRADTRTMRFILLLALLATALLAVIGYESTVQFLVGSFPTWTSLGPASLDHIAQLIRWTCFLGAGLSGAVFLIGLNPTSYRAWVIPIFRLAVVLVVFLAFFALTSPWSIYQLQFVPSIVMQSIRTGLGESFGMQWIPYLFGTLHYDGDLVGWETGVACAAGAASLLKSLMQRDFRGARLPFLFVLGFVVIFVAFLIVRVNRVTVNYALPAVPGIVLLAAYGLSELRITVAKRLGERKALATAAALAVVIAGTQIWHGVDRLAVYRQDGLVEALASDDKLLGDWLLRCVSRNAKIDAAPFSYVPPQFERYIVAESHRQLAEFKPDVVIFSEDEAVFWSQNGERLAADPYTGDVGDILAFFDEIMHSPGWQMGPKFVRYQIYVPSPPRGIVNPGCL